MTERYSKSPRDLMLYIQVFYRFKSGLEILFITLAGKYSTTCQVPASRVWFLKLKRKRITFSQPFQEKCISEVVRTGTRIIFQSE